MVRKKVVKKKDNKSTVDNRSSSPFRMSMEHSRGVVSEVLKTVEKPTVELEEGMNWEPTEGVEYPVLITGVREVESGYVVETTIFGEDIAEKSFFYKRDSSAIVQLRKFASLFPSFDGDLSKIVGQCALAEIGSTTYGFQFIRGIKSISLQEAETLAKQFEEDSDDNTEEEEFVDEEEQEDEEDEELDEEFDEEDE